MDGKVLAPLGLKSKVLPGILTHLCAWVGFCTSRPQQVVKRNCGVEGDLYKYPMKNILRTAKFLPAWYSSQGYFSGL